MTRHPPEPVDDLPRSLVDIAETLGMGVALKLMQQYGGLEVKFPALPPPDHPVIRALGETDGYALCDLLSGEQLYVPHGRARKGVRADVHRLEAQGLDRAAIARTLGISQRHVRRVANDNPADGRQGRLFDDV